MLLENVLLWMVCYLFVYLTFSSAHSLIGSVYCW